MYRPNITWSFVIAGTVWFSFAVCLYTFGVAFTSPYAVIGLPFAVFLRLPPAIIVGVLSGWGASIGVRVYTDSVFTSDWPGATIGASIAGLIFGFPAARFLAGAAIEWWFFPAIVALECAIFIPYTILRERRFPRS
jgi:hypothetical protein